MICPYCNAEMEPGRILASGAGSIPAAMLEWYAEKDFEKKGFVAALKRKGIYIKEPKGGYFEGAYYCAACNKVFGEFSTK